MLMGMPKFMFEPMSGAQIDSIAAALVRSYQPAVLTGDKAFDVHRFVDTKLEDMTGVTPIYSADLPSEIYGLTDSAENQVVIQEELANDILSEKFFRSTLAHETGHCVIHVPQLQRINRTQVFRQAKDDGVQLYRKGDIPLFCNPEWQAWRFAGALLMPEAPLRLMLNDGAELPDIAKAFEVNIAFLKTRLKALKIQK